MIVAGCVFTTGHAEHIIVGFFSSFTYNKSLTLLSYCLTNVTFTAQKIVSKFSRIV